MFTGIVQGVCRVVSVEQKTNLVAFVVDLGDELSEGLKTGASISVDGVCPLSNSDHWALCRV